MATDPGAMDHYAVLGVCPEGSGLPPMQRVMQLATIPLEELKASYKRALSEQSGNPNPFALAKLSQAFQVLSGNDRKMYDLGLLQKAAAAARLTLIS